MSLDLPPIIAGPMLRHTDAHQVTIWLVTTQPFEMECEFHHQEKALFKEKLDSSSLQSIQVGENAFIHLVNIQLEQALPLDELIGYDIRLHSMDGQVLKASKCIDTLCYTNAKSMQFVLRSNANKLLHGSCRKPHFDGKDGMLRIDDLLADAQLPPEERPSLLMLSGDQVYVDDVAGPTLSAINQVIELLGLYDESWQNDASDGELLFNSSDLKSSENSFFQRHKFLPHDSVNPTLLSKLIGASKQPIFTSVNAKNHLVTLSEVLAMYFLAWAPQLWELVDLVPPKTLNKQHLAQYKKEQAVIEDFVAGLARVQRAMAHIPVYMIFDDHDITDDWNLTRGWEEAAYQHPFAKRIIGNALIGYLFCQGWGNAPERVQPLIDEAEHRYHKNSTEHEHSKLVEQVLKFSQWHYHLNTTPKVVVLDTRTQRWRSESNPGKPSGLMDWESLTELQQELLNEPSVILVSPAPIYGVKMIETVQRVFTFFGKPLMVDAENWMAHAGTANVMLNIFRHVKTPPNFIILSGDVHYSFVYDITHKFIRNRSRIVQITASGIKNEFPASLLRILEVLNRYLYATYSPLNWFTKRRRMRIRARRPDNQRSKTLFNGSGIGLLELSEVSRHVKASILTADGETLEFARLKRRVFKKRSAGQ